MFKIGPNSYIVYRVASSIEHAEGGQIHWVQQ